MTQITPLKEIVSFPSNDPKDIPKPDAKKIVIFLVDDNELYLKSLEIQFREIDAPVIKTFLTGEACLMNMSLKPDIIILDYFLNTVNKNAMDGLKTLVKIKDASPSTQVIMSSANENAEIAVNCLKFGAFDYIVKNENTFVKLKQIIKKIFSLYSKEKEIIVWDW